MRQFRQTFADKVQELVRKQWVLVGNAMSWESFVERAAEDDEVTKYLLSVLIDEVGLLQERVAKLEGGTDAEEG